MLLRFAVILSIIGSLLSAPQKDNFKDGSNVKIFVKPTPAPSTDKQPVEVGNSPNFNQNVAGLSQYQEREGENQNSNFAVINEGLEIGSSRQNIDDPISLDDDYDVTSVNLPFPAPSANFDGNQESLPVFQGDPSSFSGGNQDVFPPFGFGPNNFPQQQFGVPPAPNQFPLQPPFVNQRPSFPFQPQQPQPQNPFFSFNHSEDPDDEDDASDKNEGDGNKKPSFLQSLFTF